jgi:hypothetical protein
MHLPSAMELKLQILQAALKGFVLPLPRLELRSSRPKGGCGRPLWKLGECCLAGKQDRSAYHVACNSQAQSPSPALLCGSGSTAE